MATAQPRRHFQTIEGMRGAGALLIVMRHAPMMFGGFRVPESFLAVDLFYLVSGFVIAHAYGERVAAGGFFKTFAITRVIRLYPLYLLGITIGLIPASIAATIDPHGWWNWGRVAEAVATGLFMIPLSPLVSANGSSLDGPTWTLLPELIANIVYAAAARFMNIAVLAVIIAVSGAGVVAAQLSYGTLDVGFNPTDQWAALARVGFSFFAGVLLFRLSSGVEQRSAWIAWVCVALLSAILAFRPAKEAVTAFELGAVLVGFPLLVWVASRYEPGPRVGRAFSFIGLMSYGIYILHQPLAVIARLVAGRFDLDAGDLNPWLTGAAFLVFLVLLSWQLDRRYDGPFRNWLRARLLPARAGR